jgi:hypothetical protein
MPNEFHCIKNLLYETSQVFLVTYIAFMNLTNGNRQKHNKTFERFNKLSSRVYSTAVNGYIMKQLYAISLLLYYLYGQLI